MSDDSKDDDSNSQAGQLDQGGNQESAARALSSEAVSDDTDPEEQITRRSRRTRATNPVPRRTKHELKPQESTLTVYRHGLQRHVTMVACGAEHTMAALEGAGMYAWGCNSHGQVGACASDAPATHYFIFQVE